MVTREQLKDLERIRDDGREFIKRLFIEDMYNQLRRIRAFLPEQEQWVEALFTKQFVLAVKPRQLGFTTMVLAFLMWKGLFSRSSRKMMSMVHEEQAVERLQQMTEVFHEGLPRVLRPGIAKNSKTRTTFRRTGPDGRRVPGFSMTRLLAGARSQGRSFTFNDYHATEMAHWPLGTSAKRNNEGRSVDEEAFASVLATIHDPTASVIVESTGNGPRGLFFQLFNQALTDPKWAFVFQKWTDVARYCEQLTDEQAQRLEADLDSEEGRLYREFGVTLGQLAFRRTRMRTFKMTNLTWRRQFPLTPQEPFMIDALGWFDAEKLMNMAQYVHPLGTSNEALRIFHPFDPTRRYIGGQDTSGGVGGDEASINILRDDQLHVATWNSNRAAPDEQGVMGWRMSNMYGRCSMVVERNNHGEDVIRKMLELGVPLWTPPPPPSAGPGYISKPGFWSSGDGAGGSKRAAMVHTREVFREGWTICNDAVCINQAQAVVEKHGGQVEALTGNDDRIYSYAMALWGAREFWSGSQTAMLETEKQRIQRILRTRATP